MKSWTSVFQFAIEIISYCEMLEERRKYIISRQLLKSGTSIGANVRAAQSPQSRADFISKMTIALKEAREAAYGLELCRACPSYLDPVALTPKINSIRNLLGKITFNSRKGRS
jgi:four helix bundle protein